MSSQVKKIALFVGLAAAAVITVLATSTNKGNDKTGAVDASSATTNIIADKAPNNITSDKATAPIVTSPDKTVDDERLGQEILETMRVVKSPLSPVVQLSTAQLIVSVANNVFVNYDQKVSWITLLSIESRFDNSAVSPAGAVGIGQLMPQFATTFSAHCGIKGLKEADLKDVIVNATVSACLFRHLLENVPHGSVNLALSAYNSGLYSSTTKNLQGLRNINNETANYITRFSYVREETNAKMTENKKEK